MKPIAITAIILAIFGDLSPGSGHLLAIVSSILAAFSFPGAPILSTIAVGYNILAVSVPTPQFIFVDLADLGNAIDQTVDIDPIPWQVGIHFLILVLGILRFWDAQDQVRG
ncbi:MAG: hypothetical protein IH996_03030 [Proteobacteria bacterium]|nr:hypothetical protein [Pseudomonadota bacterium]